MVHKKSGAARQKAKRERERERQKDAAGAVAQAARDVRASAPRASTSTYQVPIYPESSNEPPIPTYFKAMWVPPETACSPVLYSHIRHHMRTQFPNYVVTTWDETVVYLDAALTRPPEERDFMRYLCAFFVVRMLEGESMGFMSWGSRQIIDVKPGTLMVHPAIDAPIDGFGTDDDPNDMTSIARNRADVICTYWCRIGPPDHRLMVQQTPPGWDDARYSMNHQDTF